MKRKMGTFNAQCAVMNHMDRRHRALVKEALVDTGSEHTWISQTTLLRLGVTPEKEERFTLANGQTLTRAIGFVIIEVQGRITVDEVVFAQPGDLEIIGARTMEGLNLTVDPRRKKLLAAGPIPAAVALPYGLGIERPAVCLSHSQNAGLSL